MRVRLLPTILKAGSVLQDTLSDPPVSLERLTYDRKRPAGLLSGKRPNVHISPLDFLAYVSLHIPDKGEQLLRYYGWYSNKSRGLRKKDKRSPSLIPPVEEDLTPYQKQCRSAWARLIRKIYEVDPMLCPQCKHPMRVIAFIEDDPDHPEDTEASGIMGEPFPLPHHPLYMKK